MSQQAKSSTKHSALSIKNLSVEFPKRDQNLLAIDKISMHIEPGEILGVVGESGAGKSLTGLAILGLLEEPGRISGGEIYVDGIRVDNLQENELMKLRGSKIAAIFQDPLTALNPLFTIGDQLTETIHQHRDVSKEYAQKRALELLKEVGIPAAEERLEQYAHQFSGGMRQRVVVALALAASPTLIVADEPTTALDVSIQAQITSMLRRLCDDHSTGILLVTHDMGVIAETADRVCVMYAGRVVETGPVDQVIHNPQHPYTQGLMQAIPNLDQRVKKLAQIDGSMPRLNNRPSGCSFHPRCPSSGPKCKKQDPTLRQNKSTTSVACWLLEGGTA